MADNTWKFLEHQESNPEALKQAVDTLIGYTKKRDLQELKTHSRTAWKWSSLPLFARQPRWY